MFVERGAVVAGERPVVLREVTGHPVEDDAEAGLVAGVDEEAQIVRRAVARGRREVAGGLVAPGFVERVFGDRQQFEVGVALVDGIGHQALGQFPPQVGLAVGMAHPGAGMQFVDIDRLMLPVPRRAPGQPVGVAPDMARRGRDVGGGTGAHFEAAPVGVGLDQLGAAMAIDDFEAVEVAGLRCRNRRFPDARRSERMQRIDPAAPAVEVADHGNPPRIGRPDAEYGPAIRWVSAEQSVGLKISAFVKQIKRV